MVRFFHHHYYAYLTRAAAAKRLDFLLLLFCYSVVLNIVAEVEETLVGSSSKAC